jgi:PAS domain S-box-containing protein
MSDIKILYAEDDLSIVQFVKILFKKNNISDVTFALNGKEALELYNQNQYDIVITDMIMPIIDGFELIAKIKDINPQQIFVMVTALENQEDLIKAIELRVNYFIRKPINPNKFTKVLQDSIILVNQKKELELSKLLLKQYKEKIDSNTILSKTDKEGKITFVTEKFCELTGYTEDELINSSHNIIKHKNTSDEVFKELWSTIKNGKVWKGILKNRTKSGTPYWADTIISPIKDKNNNIIKYMSIVHDVTEVFTLHQDIQKQKDKLEELSADLEIKVQKRTADLITSKKEIESIHKHTKESIEYAALIQGALIPEKQLFQKYFKDYFVIWHPKDTVGGDIYLFNELRDDNECLLMYIDCTGHGVPGAFVTMLVKAVESQIISDIINQPNLDISPAWIMSYFNKSLKKLLKQDSSYAISNVGWDGGIIYYNRKTQILKFAGAETPLFYIDEKGKFNTIKGNRYSVGYKKCDDNYEYKETIINVKEGMKFYCTTDGYLDQNGGTKDFPFGKKRFGNIIKEYHSSSMADQQTAFLFEMMKYENMIENNDRNDDMTVIAFEIKETPIQYETILEYDGVLTQGIISHSVDIIEHNISNISTVANLSTVVIELTQNMMKYSKSHDTHCKDIRPAGQIEILKNKEDEYIVKSKNIVSVEDKNKIEPKLIEILTLDSQALRKRYRELRRSGENTHKNGGGIGIYEIAKLANNIEYKFTPINDKKLNFEFKAILIKGKKR